MNIPSPYTRRPKAYTSESLGKMKDAVNELFARKEYTKALVEYYHICEDYPHNEFDEIILLQMKCRLNMVASILELAKGNHGLDVKGKSSSLTSIPAPGTQDKHVEQEKQDNQDNLEKQDNLENQDNQEKQESLKGVQTVTRKPVPQFTLNYALELVNEILECSEAAELYIKATYRKIYVLKALGQIADALEVASDATRRFPNAAIFRQIFDQISTEEMKRHEERMNEETKRSLETQHRLSIFREGNNKFAFGMFINGRALPNAELDRLAEATFQEIQRSGVQKGHLENRLTIFSFNAHNSTAHISHVCSTSPPSDAEINETVCRAFFALKAGSSKYSFIYHSDKKQCQSLPQTEKIDTGELAQYQQLAMVMRDRLGRGVTVTCKCI